jgi:hypothetical protein
LTTRSNVELKPLRQLLADEVVAVKDSRGGLQYARVITDDEDSLSADKNSAAQDGQASEVAVRPGRRVRIDVGGAASGGVLLPASEVDLL